MSSTTGTYSRTLWFLSLSLSLSLPLCWSRSGENVKRFLFQLLAGFLSLSRGVFIGFPLSLSFSLSKAPNALSPLNRQSDKGAR